MELLAASGLTPMQAITAGTSTSARLVGEDKKRRTIAPGKTADLRLVKGSPDESIGDLENISAVFLGAQRLDLQSLESAIQSPQPAPLPVHLIPALIDDAEPEDGRTTAFRSKDSMAPLPLCNLRGLHFELARPAEAMLDDIKLY